MKKILIIVIISLLLLTGCTGKPTEDAHPEWDDSWLRMGDVLAAEKPSGFEPGESNDLLSVSGLYYATWTRGKGEKMTNEQGRDATVYDAQIYLLLKEGKSEEASRADVEDWIKREYDSYAIGDQHSVTVNGQEFTLLFLQAARAENPYTKGYAAFALRGANAITVELLSREDSGEDLEKILLDFLNGIHY